MPYRPEHLVHFKSLAEQRPPRVGIVFAWMLAIGIGLSVAVMLFVPWVQTAVGQGQVVSLDPQDRAQDVTTLVPGRIAQWYVQDGQRVAAGEPIARVADIDPDLLARLGAERAEVEAEIAAVQQSQAVANIDVGRSRQLLAEGLASRRDYEQSQIRVADAAAQLAQARAKLNRVNVELNRQSAQVVRAPRAGRIQTINAAAGGGLVTAGTVLAVVAPEQPRRAVELLVNGMDVPLIRPGRAVRLEFEGWPAIQFSGWPSVAYGYFDGQVRTIDPNANAAGLFRVLVEPAPGKPDWPDVRFVRLGGKVQGWVQGETVNVGYELWRQINDFPLEFGGSAAANGQVRPGTTNEGGGAASY